MSGIKEAVRRFDGDACGFFRFRKLGDRYLLTNDTGRHVVLKPKDFEGLVSGGLKPKGALAARLKEAGFVKDPAHYDCMAGQWRAKNAFLWQGPSLHIVVVTLRCNHRCVYCQASSKDFDDTRYDMTPETARKVVDTIFESPNAEITIEFQGGEPMANYPVIQEVVTYALKKNETAKKTLQLHLVSNMSLMDDAKLDWLMERGVNFCTSLDGPAAVHNRNRTYLGGNSHAETMKWWKAIMKRTQGKVFRIDALLTTTRFTLADPRAVVDQYLRLRSRGIYLRFLNPFGLARRVWERIGYTPEEFLAFYRSAMDYILEINKKKKRMFFEKGSLTFLTKILANLDPNFLDLRSPCGAGIGQIAYNYDGKVYTCDEGRMLGEMGDHSFQLGQAGADPYKTLIDRPVVRGLAVASTLETQTECSWCAFQPYCGVCPIYNYVEQGDLFGRMPSNTRCRIHKGMLDYLFERLQDPEDKAVFESWIRRANAPGMYRRN